MSKIYVQVSGCIENNGEVEAGKSDEEATFYSVYIGNPGSYKNVHDSDDKESAMAHANKILEDNPSYELDDKTYANTK